MREVELGVDVEGLFDEDLLDLLALFAGLRRDEPHAENLTGEPLGFVGRRSDLDAAALAASASVDLGLDDTPPTHLVADLSRALGAVGHPALRRGNAKPAKNLLRLILMNFQPELL